MGKRYFTVLSIAGSDPIGGAGIQADIKTCCALGAYAMTAVTAVTAQNTCGVSGYEAVSQHILKSQLDDIIKDFIPDAIKIGMLPDLPSQQTVVRWLQENEMRNVVLDPVMVATSGHSLSDESAISFMLNNLFPLATIVTPNLPEAEKLFNALEADRTFTVAAAANELMEKVPNVLIKGGHGGGCAFTDTLYMRGRKVVEFTHPKIETRNTHGTGCSLSSAIACYLAFGLPVEDAVASAISWLHKAIDKGKDYEFGHGHGPVCHNFEHEKFKTSHED